jgi:hypothetical protein
MPGPKTRLDLIRRKLAKLHRRHRSQWVGKELEVQFVEQLVGLQLVRLLATPVKALRLAQP